MSPLHRRRLSRRTAQLSLILVVGCLGADWVAYSPEQDDEMMAALTRVWSADTLTVSLCEDVAAPESDNTCQVEHVIRGGGRGRRHEEYHGNVGCGGCPYDAVAYVKGTVSGGSFTTPVAVVGEVYPGFEAPAERPYAYPFRVVLRCRDGGCAFDGFVQEDGRLQLIDSSSNATTELAPGGAASCP